MENISSRSPVYVRFTSVEFEKVLKLPKGSIFTHVNLYHSNTKLRVDSNLYQNGVKILVGGKNSIVECIEPIIDIDNVIKLKLIEISSPRLIRQYKTTLYSNLILHNEKGFYESLWDRYSRVMDITKEELSIMKYYTRVFEKV